MEIYYEGVDITSQVTVSACAAHDACGERCDSLDITFGNAAGWQRWGPKEDDQVAVYRDGYTPGVMFVNSILPMDGKFRILATSLPCAARYPRTASYAGKTLAAIMESCAMACGMEKRLYGVEGAVIPYIWQDDEGCAAFLHRLALLEGAVLKCVNGRFTAIGIDYAQGLPVARTVEYAAGQEGFRHRRTGRKLGTLTLRTPYASGTAEDTEVESAYAIRSITLPALDGTQAGRWARNKLLDVNRACEELDIACAFDPRITAMARVDVVGGTDADGEWLVQEARHDLFNGTTEAKLYRCVYTVR